jgi:soluble lytic murein transglycosylase-like protein
MHFLKTTLISIGLSIATFVSPANANPLERLTNEKAINPGSAKEALTAGQREYNGKNTDNCWISVSEKYNIPVYLLMSIAMVESNMNAGAINKNKNGSVDIGFMQINNTWLPRLRTFGIQEQHLKNPCVSIHVGAWVLASNFHQMGFNWKAIGAYNARNEHKRWIYAQKVYAMHDMLVQWSHAYKKAHIEQKGYPPEHLPRPPANWVNYARTKANLKIAGKI